MDWLRPEVPLDPDELRRVEVALKDIGYWYPPDAMQAVLTGRESYVSLGGHEWPLRPPTRERIQRAMKSAGVRQPWRLEA